MMIDIGSKITEESIVYSLQIIELYRKLWNAGIGANVREAQSGKGTIAKLFTAHKEPVKRPVG